jgi:hypothetical protein
MDVLKSRKQLAVSKPKEELISDILIETTWWTTNSPQLSWFDRIDGVPNLNPRDDLIIELDSESGSKTGVKFPEEAAEGDMVLLSDSEDDDDGDSTLQDEKVVIATSAAGKGSINLHSIAVPDLLRNTALWYFGYNSFRDGQR